MYTLTIFPLVSVTTKLGGFEQRNRNFIAFIVLHVSLQTSSSIWLCQGVSKPNIMHTRINQLQLLLTLQLQTPKAVLKPT